ncbi:MAG: hypothetical protein LC623_05780 [Halobacteriales archaeon]|nr:hypothetical protein [Halobacteriales archaeon]
MLEQMMFPALEQGGYEATGQQVIGLKPHGRKHKVDTIATKNRQSILISQKWQQSGGTAEEKVAFEVICLADAIKKSNGKFSKAIVVLGGDGWTLRDWYVNGGLKSHIVDHALVEVLTLEQFVARANKGKL